MRFPCGKKTAVPPAHWFEQSPTHAAYSPQARTARGRHVFLGIFFDFLFHPTQHSFAVYTQNAIKQKKFRHVMKEGHRDTPNLTWVLLALPLKFLLFCLVLGSAPSLCQLAPVCIVVIVLSFPLGGFHLFTKPRSPFSDSRNLLDHESMQKGVKQECVEAPSSFATTPPHAHTRQRTKTI